MRESSLRQTPFGFAERLVRHSEILDRLLLFVGRRTKMPKKIVGVAIAARRGAPSAVTTQYACECCVLGSRAFSTDVVALRLSALRRIDPCAV